jgi:hypothetical protein
MDAANNRPHSVIRKLLIVSLAVNLLFAIKFAINAINRPKDRYGILTAEYKAFFQIGENEYVPIVIPKGAIVQDASPRGFDRIALFDPYRFQIMFTSDKENIVDYSVDLHDRRSFFRYSSKHSKQHNEEQP